MPIIQIFAFEGRSIEQKRELVRNVTQGVCDALEVEPEEVSVLVHDMSKSDWASAGVLASERDRA